MKIYDGRVSFYQWDLNQKITSPDLAIGEEVHFYNKFQTDALPVVAYALEDGTVVADVPNILLMSALSLFAYRYVKNGDSEHTKVCHIFEVKSRPKPSDYIYTETELHDVKSIVKEVIAEMGGMQKAKVAKIGEVTLLASKWVGENNLYSQIVEIEGVTEYSQVDLTPDVEQLAVFYNKDITFVTENEDGVVTVFVIGQKPENDYTIQVTITEVDI